VEARVVGGGVCKNGKRVICKTQFSLLRLELKFRTRVDCKINERVVV
jgi:hypothetical protein